MIQRKLTILFLVITLSWTTFACSAPSSNAARDNSPTAQLSRQPLKEGKYPIQQATYDDINGEYNLLLLNTPAGTPPQFSTTDLQLARLTDEQIQAGERTHLQMENNQATMYLTEDFRIEYVHNVTETQQNPQTGQPETVIVRRESNFWTPFAGAFAGQMAANLLFTPRYYVPPVYQPGGMMVGYGGYGSTYGQAVERYQSRYQAPPAAVRNRQAIRTTGAIRRSPSATQPNTRRPNTTTGTRSTGSGYGGTDLRRSNPSAPQRTNRPSFGSGSRNSRPVGGGARRRR
ncbi:hypothetical protein H6G20_24920 [Desertifilum sp. FACHB-1129]|uniref:hypothetical protein n=1 Tax=Desertifilum TaxID=1185872 RepID=UPI000B281BD9|nr:MULTISPECIES: hypothetical protein [Desertifilum]MBD2314915.1 hypothetical protein [Desertifilum sp. FACHB-1129]MBD2325136.1 hypothetical protein [Desertifilum sp. FACHB-866]MBD2332722.1 hypothetical protein [Desertifilum sp. FACHB-868]MDA0209318.1 hypothetical protein [Cyanobacteria bacterium FC1]